MVPAHMPWNLVGLAIKGLKVVVSFVWLSPGVISDAQDTRAVKAIRR